MQKWDLSDRKTVTLITIAGVLLGTIIAAVGAFMENSTVCNAGTVVMIVALLFRIGVNRNNRIAEEQAMAAEEAAEQEKLSAPEDSEE